jgi:hypothetical protein
MLIVRAVAFLWGLLACVVIAYFGTGVSRMTPNQSLEPTRFGKAPLAAQLQRCDSTLQRQLAGAGVAFQTNSSC